MEGLLGKEYSFSDLEMQTLQYPYAYAFRLLMVSEMKKRGDVRLPSELRTAAVYAPDRRALYDFVENTAEKGKARETEDRKNSQEVKPETKEETKKEEAKKPTQTQGFDIESMLQDMPDITTEQPKEENPFSEIDAFLNRAGQTGGKLNIAPQREYDDNENEEKGENATPPQKQDIDEPFSETLAKIYIKQRKYDKAIKTFQKLMGKYPEKSVYFADQIRFLEKLIQNI